MGLNNAKGNGDYNSGKYIPVNPNKYIGNPGDIQYRSSWEYKMCVYLDHAQHILKWGCETIQIPYVGADGQKHRYFPDFYTESLNAKGEDIKMLIEVKPAIETRKPKMGKKSNAKALESMEYKVQMWEKNVRKWDQALQWCKNRGIIFKLVTEDSLFNR